MMPRPPAGATVVAPEPKGVRIVAQATTAAQAPRRLGDRVEEAIERRTDVAQEIAEGEASPPPRRRLIKRGIWLAVTCVSLYLVAPGLGDVLGSWDDVARLGAGWLVGMALLQVAVLACLWTLQRLALHTKVWRAVISSQLASNAMSKVAPGGAALGPALQYRMLVESGVKSTHVAGGLTASNLVTFAIVLALPVMAIPAIIRGGVQRTLLEATIVGVAAFLVLASVAAACAISDRPLVWVGATVQRVRNRLRRRAAPLTELPRRLLRERDRILEVLGARWKAAVLAGVGRWGFDYATLLAAL